MNPTQQSNIIAARCPRCNAMDFPHATFDFRPYPADARANISEVTATCRCGSIFTVDLMPSVEIDFVPNMENQWKEPSQ